MREEDTVLDPFFRQLESMPVMEEDERARLLRELRVLLDRAIDRLAKEVAAERRLAVARRQLTDKVTARLAERFRKLPPKERATKAVRSRWAPVYLRQMVSSEAERSFWRLVEGNLGYVVYFAENSGWMAPGMPMSDRIQAGMFGLVDALARFDPDQGKRLTTYADHWMRQALGREVRAMRRGLHLSHGLFELMKRIDRTQSASIHSRGRRMDADELAQVLGVNKGRVEEAMFHSYCRFNIKPEQEDRYDNEHRSQGPGHYRQCAVERRELVDGLHRRIAHEKVRALVKDIMRASLSRRERDMVTRRMGLDGFDPMSADELAERHRLSGTGAREVLKRAMAKMRAELRSRLEEDESLHELLAA